MQRLAIARSAMRRVRHFSTAAKENAASGAAQAIRQEYPTSFISHLTTKKMNLFNIGMAFLTLSLSSRLLTARQRYEKAETENAELGDRVDMLEQLVVSLGGTVPTDETKEAAAAAAEEAATADAERVKKAREEEARALTAIAAAATEGSDGKPKKKGVLI